MRARLSLALLLAAAALPVAAPAAAQTVQPPGAARVATPASPQDVLEQIRQLRDELAALQAKLAALQDSIAQDHELLGARVEEHEQTKVESGSKYHVRLSGLVLMNLVSTQGAVDNLDLPFAAAPRPPGGSDGSFGASVRQSTVGLDVFGPGIGGAKSSGDFALDFFGGFPATPDGLSAPQPRLRTANVKLNWSNVAVAAGQDTPFFSPRSPTSLASNAYPALASAGNLWSWTPQLYVERRNPLPGGSLVTLQGGVLDPLTGELPAAEYDRLPTAGERSRMPAVAARAAWQSQGDSPAASAGGGVYYARQNWGFDRRIGAWAATADWDVSLRKWLGIAGEVYRGRALAGLGGGLNPSVLFDGAPVAAAEAIVAVQSTGGWLQVKVAPSSRLQFNGAWGGDKPSCPSAPRCTTLASVDPLLMRRNSSGSVNAIYQARSNLLVSIEYRRLWTTPFGRDASTANHISLNTGIGF